MGALAEWAVLAASAIVAACAVLAVGVVLNLIRLGLWAVWRIGTRREVRWWR